MNESDPYRGTNPWSLARYLRNGCSRCPVCRLPCGFDITVDRNEETISMVSDCGNCGSTALTPYIGEDGDLVIMNGDSVYEPDQKCFEISGRLGDLVPAGKGMKELAELSEVAAAYAETRRSNASVELGKKIASEYRANIGKEGWEGADNLCLAQCTATASVLVGFGDNKKALELFDEYLPLTEGNDSGKSFAFILARAFSQFSEGDPKEPTAAVRAAIQSLDRMKSENRLPADDPFVRSRAYEALGFLLSAKNDKTGAMKALKKSLEEARDVVAKDTTEDGLRWMNRCSREYAFACFQADMKKRSMEALKDSVKICAANRAKFPSAYAESLLERGMFISDSGADIPPYLRGDMDEAIAILGKPDGGGRYDPLLPVAYYYRSMTGADKEKLDPEDLGKAYAIIRDGVKTGDVPDSVLSSVVDTYVVYLDANDEETAKTVRRELAELGIWVRPPAKKKLAEAPKSV